MKILYVVNHVSFFVSHRLPLAMAAQNAGYETYLITGRAGSEEMEGIALKRLQSSGVRHTRVSFSSSGINPISELVGLIWLTWLVFRLRPDIMHCASPKGVLYGGLAARLCRVPNLVLAVSGMGYAFTDGGGGALRWLVRTVYRTLSAFAFNHPNKTVIVQNRDDYNSIITSKLALPSSIELIPGSGVELALYKNCSYRNKRDIVLLPARLLRDKGVYEFVEAAKSLKSMCPGWRFFLVGEAGYDNPSAIHESEIRLWDDYVAWTGHVDDMVPYFSEAAIVCLPSYREGMPKALLEAAAAGCAVVTTDVPGCRDAVEPGLTGELVPVRDSRALADALLSLINNKQRREAMGKAGQERASSIFSLNSVVQRTLDIYKEL